MRAGRFSCRVDCIANRQLFPQFSAQSPPLETTAMKAIEITECGAPEVWKRAERPMPEAKAGEVLVKVSASGVNRPDVFQRKGSYAPPPGASDLPGLEVAGGKGGGRSKRKGQRVW